MGSDRSQKHSQISHAAINYAFENSCCTSNSRKSKLDGKIVEHWGQGNALGLMQ
jgi:hypothetical protein